MYKTPNVETIGAFFFRQNQMLNVFSHKSSFLGIVPSADNAYPLICISMIQMADVKLILVDSTSASWAICTISSRIRL
ncbi:MAG: hypothetical protein ACI9IJ_001491 [Psychromonas sp.]